MNVGGTHTHTGGHAHGHDEDGRGAHHGHGSGRAFLIGFLLNLGLVAVEVWYGFAVNSLALLADAGHHAGHVVGLLLAGVAAWLTRRPASARRTYGLGRSTILASLANAILLLVGAGAIALEAVRRLIEPQPIAGVTVMWVAALAIVVNTGTAAMFMAGRRHDINVRAAFTHMAADALVALGVVVAAGAIALTGWLWLDPAVGLIIVVVIVAGTWGLLRDSLNLAMDAVPAGIDREEVSRYLAAEPGVSAIHDLHIWPLSTTSVALTAHLVVPQAAIGDDALNRLSAELSSRFGIGHSTFQIERGDGASCPLDVAVHGA